MMDRVDCWRYAVCFSSPWKKKCISCLVLPAPSGFPMNTSGRTFCCADSGPFLMEKEVKFPFPAAGAGCQCSALLKAFPHRVSWAENCFELTELENKWLIQPLISHLVHVIYFDPWHVHHPFIGICSRTCALEIGVSPGSKISCMDSSQPVFLLNPAVLSLHEAMGFLLDCRCAQSGADIY